MPQYKTGDAWALAGVVDHFLVPACSELKGTTQALKMTDAFGKKLLEWAPGIDEAIGKWIHDSVGSCGIYGINAKGKVGVFQTRITDFVASNLGTISFSCKALKAAAEAVPEETFLLLWPTPEMPDFVVLSLLETLPFNVEIWK